MFLEEFKGFDYEAQDIEETTMLSDIPLALLTDSIKQQFDDPVTYGENDFVQTFETKYQLTKQEMDEENEEEITQLYIQFISFMQDILKEKLGIGMPYLDDMPEGEQLQLIHYIYRYFILNIKENFFNFILHYIKKNKKDIASDIEAKDNIVTRRLGSVVEDPDELKILTKLSHVIHDVMENADSVDEFLDLSNDDEGCLENEFINEKYDDFNITGNFMTFYPKMLPAEDLITIECEVRNAIISPYVEKKKDSFKKEIQSEEEAKQEETDE